MMRRREARLGWLFISPAFFHLVVFALFPMGYALYLSFFKWHLIKDVRQYVGSSNYAFCLTDETFLHSLWNSAKYSLLSVPFGMALGLAVAILVNQKLRGISIFRTIYYIPAISSGVAIAMLWIYVYLPETGLLNSMALGLLGEHGRLTPMVASMLGKPDWHLASIDFLNSTQWAMIALAFMSGWVGLGPKMVLFLAGLLGIPQSLYEAAELDGAGRWRSFVSVTLPMLAPTTFFVLVTSTIGALQVFTPVYMMTKGGPDESTNVVGYQIYQEAWVTFHTGLAAAESFVLLALIAVVSLAQFRMMKSTLVGYATT